MKGLFDPIHKSGHKSDSTLFGMKGSITDLHCGIGGKMYDLVKSVYLQNMGAVKIEDKLNKFGTQRKGVHQDCILRLALLNVYIND